LEQLDGYLAGLGLDGGWLAIFDRRSGQPPIRERTSSDEMPSPQGRRIRWSGHEGASRIPTRATNSRRILALLDQIRELIIVLLHLLEVASERRT